jgi:uncharacterized low-complexity protein
MLTAAVSEADKCGETKCPAKARKIAEAVHWFIVAMREK